MANQAGEIALSDMVGIAFVQEYYNKLSRHPEDVHKFYADSSVVSRPDSNGVMTTVRTLADIDQVILSVDHKNYVINILTTDAQASFGDGVLVLVTGLLTGNDNIQRKFTQSFFLAQQNGTTSYYVLNDVLRYVGEEVAPTLINVDERASEPELTLVAEQSLPDNSTTPLERIVVPELSIHSLDNGNVNTPEVEVLSNQSIGATQNGGNEVSALMQESDALPVADVAASPLPEDAPKKSYASVANALNFKKEPFQQRVLPVKPLKPVQAPVIAPIVAPEVALTANNNKPVEKPNTQVNKGYSIFVANLPMNATEEQLQEVFEKFGAIKPNGIQVRSYKQEKNCFGFVEFESESSVKSALEVSSIDIGGRQAHIEEKKANTEGSKFQSRRSGFKGDGFRNRGNNRGFGRNEFDNGQSRGSNSRRNGEAGNQNQKVYQNGGGRAARQGQGQVQAEGQEKK